MRIPRLLALALALSQALGVGTTFANPLDPVLVNGSATFNNNGNVLTIVNTPGTIINWGSFNIGGNEITRFLQQGPSSGVLNRITGQDPSVILGALQSNGHVFLVNPNGVVFGSGAKVDVNGLIASSLDIKNDDFRAGRLSFNASTVNPGAVKNDGAITTPSGGRVYLIAPSVENSGLISSPQGEVVLAAGRQVQLVDSHNPDLHVVASAPADHAVNLGQVISQGGSIGIYGALINQRGVVNADSATVGENGRIVFKASDTTLLEAGSTTSARGAGEGGTIHVLGDHVGVVGDASIDASGRTGGGTVLVGGDYRGLNPAIGNASATYVGAGTSIRADATDSGNGGRVIVYSTNATRAYGQISARGGVNSGNGGFAEVSGRDYLDYRGRADLRATNGHAGTLLLDPNDITIQATGTTNTTTQGPTFSGGTGSSIITTTDLQSQLGLGNVTVSTSAGTGGPQGGHITVASAFGWSNANALTLDADKGISINGAITGNADGHLFLTSRGGSITQTAPIGVTYLGINSVGDVNLAGATNTVNVLAANVASGNLSFLNGTSLTVGTVGALSGISVPGRTVWLHATSGQITQSPGAIITANFADFAADTVNLGEANNVGTISGAVTGQLLTFAASADGATRSYTPGVNAFSFTNQGTLTVGNVAGHSGITAATGDITLTSNTGSLSLTNAATATNGGVFLNAYQGAILGSANGLAVAAYAGGAITLNTQVSEISAGTSSATGAITINNTGALTVDAISNNGSGAISVTASGPLAVNGISTRSGAVTLSAGPTGASTDDLTINGNITTQVDTGGAIETSGPVLLRAGDTITVNGTISGNVTQKPYLNNPGTALPSITDCIANPALAGCSQVLPTLDQCLAQPATAGCVVVMPTLEQCTLNPGKPGCSAVLPSLQQCTATPTLAGCTAVLPPMATCIAQPTTAGCAAVLPSIQQCTTNPSLTGCSVVLPSLTQCMADPSIAGCGSVLPSFQQCMANASIAGCSTVLAPFNACLADPSMSICAGLLPSLQTCQQTPSLLGCSQVIQLAFNACLTRPSAPGCAGILPSISTCVQNRATPGCQVVLPTMQQCIASPTLQGCGVVLPALEQCAVNPALQGCEAVLPRPDFCSTHPTDPTCAVFMPSLEDNSKKPIDQAVNQTVTLINNVNAINAVIGKPVVPGPTASTGSSNNEKPATKLYCN